jgi:hypothetical protein
MGLPSDYTRCNGTYHPICQACLRNYNVNRPANKFFSHMHPPIDVDTGSCAYLIPLSSLHKTNIK